MEKIITNVIKMSKYTANRSSIAAKLMLSYYIKITFSNTYIQGIHHFNYTECLLNATLRSVNKY